MSRKNIPARLRQAGVPRACWETRCDQSGLDYINTWAAGAEDRFNSRDIKQSVFVKATTPDSIPAALARVELHARQATVHNIRGKYLTFARLIQLLRQDPAQPLNDDEERTTLQDVFTRGYIAIPILPGPEPEKYTPRDYEEAFGYLASHLYEGGMLITSGRNLPYANANRRDRTTYPVEFEKVFSELSIIVEV